MTPVLLAVWTVGLMLTIFWVFRTDLFGGQPVLRPVARRIS